jgi:putative lipoprotein
MGTVTTRRGNQLPRGSVLTIRLVDITDPRSSLTPIAQRRYQNPGPVPIPFELSYDPDQIAPGRRYALRAAVTVNGLPSYETRERYEVFGDGPPRRVDMILESPH